MAALISWWIMIEVMGLLALPLTFRLFGAAMSHGYPFAKIVFVLFWTYLAWLGGFVVPMSTALYGSLLLVAVAGVAGYAFDRELRQWITGPGAAAMLRHDALWTFGFAFFVFQRGMVPDISGAEKFMDFAFLNSLYNTDAMPPADPWMSGGIINYYYFGYLMFANLARVFTEPIYLTYNLCVATIGGLAFSQTSAVVLGLTRKWGYAILGGFLSAILGNLDGAQQVLEKGSLRPIDVWRSSRVVGRGDTINEFPFFSTIHGDLHPHFIVLPIAIVFLAALLDEKMFPVGSGAAANEPRTASVASLAFVTFLFAAMVGISTWELPLGAVALALLAGRGIPLKPVFSRARLVFGVQVALAVVATYVLFLPFYLNFHAPPSSPAFQVATSSFGQFLLVFGHLLFPITVLLAIGVWRSQPSSGGESRHLIWAVAGLGLVFAVMAGNGVLPALAVMIAGALFLAYTGPPEDRRGYLMIATGLIGLIACELVYLRDSYGERLYRMNTVFKLYFQAWTILVIVAPWAISKLLSGDRVPAGLKRAFLPVMAILLAGTACYPIGVTQDRLAWGRERTLDGNLYLQRDHRDDYAVIEWLRENTDKDDVIVEASGNPYSYYARFSSNTGRPTLMGWANHEGLWRAHDPEVGKRQADVRRIYDSRSLENIRPLLDQYGVKYIIVGEIEHKDHAAGLAKFDSLPRVFESGRAAVYEVK